MRSHCAGRSWQYEAVGALASHCVCDSELTAEESQICAMLDGRLEASQHGGEAAAIDKLAMGWEELLALANEVHA